MFVSTFCGAISVFINYTFTFAVTFNSNLFAIVSNKFTYTYSNTLRELPAPTCSG